MVLLTWGTGMCHGSLPPHRVQGSEMRVQGSGSRIHGSGFKVLGSGSWVQGYAEHEHQHRRLHTDTVRIEVF